MPLRPVVSTPLSRRLGALAPPGPLLPGLHAFPDQLAALAPSDSAEFLAANLVEPRRRHDLDWIASCNLLAHAVPARFLAAATRDLAIELELRVVSEAGQELRSRGLGYGVACGVGRELPVWIPPIAEYDLMSGSAWKNDVFAPGPLPVSVRRVVSKYPGGGCRWSRDVDAQRYRLALLSELAGQEQVDTALAQDLDVPIVWSDAASFTREVRAARERVEHAWAGIVDGLIRRRFLDADTALRTAPIRVRVTDERYETDVALPVLDVK